MAGSKFKGLLDAAREREPEETPAAPTSEPSTPQTPENLNSQVSGDLSTQKSAPKKGRPPGKRSDPDYDQFTVHLRIATHRAIKIALLQEGEGREVSELVEELLSGWLKSKV